MDITYSERFYVNLLHEEIQNDAPFPVTTLCLLVLFSWSVFVIGELQHG